MKKNLKAIIAAMLAAIMAFGGLTAFAADDTKKLEWDYYGYYYYYDYAGELKEGENAFEKGPAYIWYDFEVPADGFYSFSYDTNEGAIEFYIPKSFEGLNAYNSIENFYFQKDEVSNYIFYLEAGEQLVGMDIIYYSDMSTLNEFVFDFEYLGDEIESVTTAESLILDYDIYDEGDGWYYVSDEITIEFSAGKEICFSGISCTSDKEITSGKNTLTLNFFGKEHSFDVDVILISDYVESAELSNYEDYTTVYAYYDDSFTGETPYFETITVTFKDGTKAVAALDEDSCITLPNGKEVYCEAYYDFYDGSADLNIYVAGNIINTYECTVLPVSTSENIDTLKSNTEYWISESLNIFHYGLSEILESGDFDYFINYGAANAMEYFSWSFRTFIQVFVEAYSFATYLITR